MAYGFNDNKSKATLATVATTGNYNNLNNRPSIPTGLDFRFQTVSFKFSNIAAGQTASQSAAVPTIAGYKCVGIAAWTSYAGNFSIIRISPENTMDGWGGNIWTTIATPPNVSQQTIYVDVMLLYIKTPY